MDTSPSRDPQAEVVGELDDLFEEFEEPTLESQRRVRGSGRPSMLMAIVERDGVLYVEGDATRVRGRRGESPPEKVVWERRLSTLDRNQVVDWLVKLDRKLTPHRGLRRLEDRTWQEISDIDRIRGRCLLIVHGTFSNCDNVLAEIQKSERGEEFLNWAQDEYRQILSFDHPTVGVSPMINAHDLSRQLGGTEAEIDVVSHSRGGLVTRWWVEAFDRGNADRRRVIFVGSPLAGTGLAAPPNIKGALGLLSNVSQAVGAATSLIPLMSVVGVLFKVVSSVTKITAKTPAIDAALAMIPGLSAQSRVGNNHELLTIRQGMGPWEHRYYAVKSNFESPSPGWKFWRYFRRDLMSDRGADLVFASENDLVVDTGSMTELTDDFSLPDDQVLDFGTNESVHHLNYFQQPETLDFITSSFSRR